MPSREVRSTTWRRVGLETQEAEGHRVHAQKDLVSDSWRFVAVRKGDGIHQCKVLATFDTAKEARAACEADVYEFHWADLTTELADKIRGAETTLEQRMQMRLAWEDEKTLRRKQRKELKRDKAREQRTGAA